MPTAKSVSTAPVVLVTGFDAFGGGVINPSWLAAQALHGQIIEGHQIVAAMLQTEFDASRQLLAALLMRANKPELRYERLNSLGSAISGPRRPAPVALLGRDTDDFLQRVSQTLGL